jgi:hypothetical protein
MFKEQEEKLQLNPNSTFVEGYEQEVQNEVVEKKEAPEVVVEEQVDVVAETPREEIKEEKRVGKKLFGFEPSSEISGNDEFDSANLWSKTLLDKVA